MNKSHLIESVSLKTNVPTKDADTATNLFFDIIIDSLKNGDRIELRGFGSFKIRHYDEYRGRNPKDGSSILVKPKKIPVFKPGKNLKLLVNYDL
jgi:integration host factor subunit beta